MWQNISVRLPLAFALIAGLWPGRLAAEEIVLFAAASLTDVLREVGEAFEASSGHELVMNLGASSDLARQIKAGATADVFFSADGAQMEGLERAGLVNAADHIDLLSNVLVVVVPADSKAALGSIAALRRMQRIALANPEAVPAGVYARTYLQAVGLWDELDDKVVPLLDVRAALAAVESGHADAGIVYRTDAALSQRVRIALEVPREQGPRIVYVLAPLAAARKTAARDLVRFLVSDPARATYQKHGFLVLPTR